MPDPIKKYYTVAEAAVALDANQVTIRRWVDKGRLQRAWDQVGQLQITGASVRKFPGKQKPGRPKKQPVVKEPRGVAQPRAKQPTPAPPTDAQGRRVTRRGTKIAKGAVK
jgi:hypothetical protein